MSEVPQPDQRLIFLNYRRTDAGWPADLLASKLASSFGQACVFQDVRGIEAGDDFAAVLQNELDRAAVLIVLISNNWLHVQDRFGRRRLDNEHDWVRREIRIALGKQDCKVIPVLLDDAELPDEQEALPEDISPLLRRERIRLRQANSDDDIEALSKVLDKCGFRRLADSATPPLPDREFSDKQVNDVFQHLRRLHEQQPMDRHKLILELDLLFNRKTFRFEALRECPEQRWADRLDSGYQTAEVLNDCVRIVQEVAAEKYLIYRDLVREVETYCMQMGMLLFDPPVDYNAIEEHIGKNTFKAHLPKEHRFTAGPDRQPRIPDRINDNIEPHRLRAVELMDQFVSE
jgi:hypothetical protein